MLRRQPFAARGLIVSQQQKGLSQESREQHPCTVHQTKVNTMPDDVPVTERGPAY